MSDEKELGNGQTSTYKRVGGKVIKVEEKDDYLDFTPSKELLSMIEKANYKLRYKKQSLLGKLKYKFLDLIDYLVILPIAFKRYVKINFLLLLANFGVNINTSSLDSVEKKIFFFEYMKPRLLKDAKKYTNRNIERQDLTQGYNVSEEQFKHKFEVKLTDGQKVNRDDDYE